jgi:hypothetical protein
MTGFANLSKRESTRHENGHVESLTSVNLDTRHNTYALLQEEKN